MRRDVMAPSSAGRVQTSQPKRPPRRWLCSFADSRFWRSLERIRRQAARMNMYDAVRTLTERDLTPSFRERFRDRLVVQSRGYGYWVWKPQVILQLFN